MFNLIRLIFYGWAIYAFYLLGFPAWKGAAYHFVAPTMILLAAVGLYVFIKLMRLGTMIGTILFELAFAVGVLLYVGWTMPQRSGKSPIQLWIEGHRPSRRHAAEGIERLGLDPDSKAARFMIGFFPKR